MRLWRRVISNMKDAVAYFGFRQVFRRRAEAMTRAATLALSAGVLLFIGVLVSQGLAGGRRHPGAGGVGTAAGRAVSSAAAGARCGGHSRAVRAGRPGRRSDARGAAGAVGGRIRQQPDAGRTVRRPSAHGPPPGAARHAAAARPPRRSPSAPRCRPSRRLPSRCSVWRCSARRQRHFSPARAAGLLADCQRPVWRCRWADFIWMQRRGLFSKLMRAATRFSGKRDWSQWMSHAAGDRPCRAGHLSAAAGRWRRAFAQPASAGWSAPARSI